MSRFCEYCGEELDGSARFCENCGAKVDAAPEERPREEPEPEYTGGLARDSAGKYRWYYELSLLKNPTVFITCFKVFTLVVGIVSVMMFFILLGDGFGEALLFMLKFFVIGVVGMTVLLALGYFVYAAVQGFKYCVVFEMDDKCVTHTQLAKQFKKAQVVAGLVALMGASRGSLSMVGTGLLVGSRNSMKTSFKDVRAIKVNRRRGVIYLRSGAQNNQIYARPEEFGTVLEYILERIPDTAKRKGI